MVHTYWFKPKRYGYGTTPSTWEGWAVTAVYCLIISACTVAIVTHRHELSIIIGLALLAAAATIALFVIAVKKTDGPWGWRWGANAGAKQMSGKND
jgi:multisubunit Na+/H+ antiporter MnhC subunit